MLQKGSGREFLFKKKKNKNKRFDLLKTLWKGCDNFVSLKQKLCCQYNYAGDP